MTATQFSLVSVWDNLSDAAKFYYNLSTDTGEKVVEGNLDMTGQDYENWGTSGDINLSAYQWGATQLNLSLL